MWRAVRLCHWHLFYISKPHFLPVLTLELSYCNMCPKGGGRWRSSLLFKQARYLRSLPDRLCCWHMRSTWHWQQHSLAVQEVPQSRRLTRTRAGMLARVPSQSPGLSAHEPAKTHHGTKGMLFQLQTSLIQLHHSCKMGLQAAICLSRCPLILACSV